jgi:GDP/UDP-N,N'-diacetylbacillosamine 2-epimerase (hydrolysing)
MNLGILTSSRADFGIYVPLLDGLKNNDYQMNFEIIAFGTHLSHFHGYTINAISEAGFDVKHEIPGMLLTDDKESVASSYAIYALKFSAFWSKNASRFDWVICLGDRYEMAAAVAAGIPFGINFAHIGGGETTEGAIDNVYRHSISLASKLHFVAHSEFAKRVYEITASKNIIISGSLGLDNLQVITILSEAEFQQKWNITLSSKFILVTVHPETVQSSLNEVHCRELIEALEELSINHSIVITMPNADTSGNIYRSAFQKLVYLKHNIYLVENFGTQSYFSAMHYADFLIGNTSSGIIEAASFNKYVINLGERQKGRLAGENVIHVPFKKEQILEAANHIQGTSYQGKNIYMQINAANTIIEAFYKQWI